MGILTNHRIAILYRNLIMTLDPIYCLTIMVKNNPSSGKAPVEASIEIKVEDGGYSDDLATCRGRQTTYEGLQGDTSPMLNS